MPFLMFVAPRVADSTLHPNCAFIQGSKCDGITLGVGQVGLLGDRKVQLIGLEQQGNEVVASVIVSEPGLTSEATLLPSYSLSEGGMANRPEFPGMRFQLGLEGIDLQANTALLNIEAPGTGLLENQRTLFTFLAANLGFTALFIWMMFVRADLLGLQWALAQRRGALA